jgi:hypothetical protein
MSRNLLASAIAYLADTSQVKIAHLVKIELAESTEISKVYMYVTDYANSIIWDGQTYQAGKITNIGQLRQTQGLTNYKLSVDIAGEFQEELDRGLVDHNNKSYVGRQVEVLRAYLDAAGDIIPFDIDTNGPMQYFIGDISSINIDENPVQGFSTVTWECAGKFQDFELINGRFTDDSAHRGLVASDDGLGTQIPSSGAKKEAYKTDTGFQHSNQTINTVTGYTTSETRYRTKTSWFGFKTKVIESEVDVFNTLELGVTLAARALPKVYGVRKVPGIPVFMDTLKGQKGLYIVYAFCVGEIDSVLNFYLDEVPLICSSNEDSSNRVCLGNQAAGDTLSAYSSISAIEEIQLTDKGFAYFNIYDDYERGEPSINLTIPTDAGVGRTEGTQHEQAFTITNDTGRRWVKIYHGQAGQTACPELVAEAAAGNFSLQSAWAQREYGDDWVANEHKYWDSFSTLEDTCYAVVKVDITEDTTVPVLEAVISGELVYTYNSSYVRSSLPEYTLNPVWHLLNYITDSINGGGLDINLVDIPSFYRVAAYLDEITTTYGDSFVTYWRYLGWKDLPGTNTVPLDAGFHDTQKTRMQTNSVIQTEVTVTKNIAGQLKQFDGTINILGSKYHLSVEGNDSPIADITSDEIIRKIKTVDLSSKNKWNSIQASIVNPAQGWGITQINFFNNNFLEADNKIPKKGNVSFNGITNYYTAREWAQVQLSKSRYSREVSFTTYYKYSYLYPNANVTLTYGRFGYSKKVFRVKTCVLETNGLVSLTLEDYDESIYTGISSSNDNSGEATPTVPKVLPPKNIEFVQLPSGRFPGLTLENYPDVNGFLLWDVSTDSNILRYDVSDWLGVGTGYGVPLVNTITDNTGKVKHFINVDGMEPSTDYEFKVRTISPRGAASKWAIVPITLVTITSVQYSVVTDFVAANSYQGQYYQGTELTASWSAHSNPTVTRYLVEVYDLENELLRLENLPKTNLTYTYSLEKNIADYALNNGGAVGAFRGVTMKIRATNDVGDIVSERTELA